MTKMNSKRKKACVTEDTPYRIVINRDRSDQIAQIWEEMNDLLPELEKGIKSIKKAKTILQKLAGDLYEGRLVELKERKN